VTTDVGSVRQGGRTGADSLLRHAVPVMGTVFSFAMVLPPEVSVQRGRSGVRMDPQAALAEVKELQTILPICMYCKSIRNDENYWQTVEAYISHHTNTQFTHGICPSCYENVVEPQFGEARRK